jgi:hypothetical protein
MVDWRDHRPVVTAAGHGRVRVSCTCGQVLGSAKTTDGVPPVLLLIHRHRADLA